MMMRHIFGHHKCGTIWLNMILKRLCIFERNQTLPVNGITRYQVTQSDIAVLFHANTDNMVLRDTDVGVHIIRDPRDIAVSAYFSHMNSHLAWQDLVPHRKILQTSAQSDGLLADIKWSAEMPKAGKTIRIFDGLGSYFKDPRVSVLRFEFLVSDPLLAIKMLMERLQLPVMTDGHIKGVLHQVSFKNLTGRELGEEDPNSHMRKGVPGDWVNYFTPEIKDYFKQRWGGLVIGLGYEKNNDW
jgi:hypothetical protein